MAKNNKGVERKEYPKLVKVGKTKVRVLNEAEEKALASENKTEAKSDNKTAGWGQNT